MFRLCKHREVSPIDTMRTVWWKMDKKDTNELKRITACTGTRSGLQLSFLNRSMILWTQVQFKTFCTECYITRCLSRQVQGLPQTEGYRIKRSTRPALKCAARCSLLLALVPCPRRTSSYEQKMVPLLWCVFYFSHSSSHLTQHLISIHNRKVSVCLFIAAMVKGTHLSIPPIPRACVNIESAVHRVKVHVFTMGSDSEYVRNGHIQMICAEDTTMAMEFPKRSWFHTPSNTAAVSDSGATLACTI